MPQKPNKLVRTVVPLVLVVGAIGVLAAIFVTNQRAVQRRQQPAQQQTQQQGQPRTPATPGADEPTPPGEPAADRPEAPPDEPELEPAEPPAGLHARVLDDGLEGPVHLGAEQDGSPYYVSLEISPFGIGVDSLELSTHYRSIDRKLWTELQSEHVFSSMDASGNPVPYAMATPFAALGVTVGDQYVRLIGSPNAPVWRAIGGRGGAFEAFVDDEEGRPVLRLERVWQIAPGSYDLRLRQRIENLTAEPLEVEWRQLGPTDLPKDSVTYGGDKRRVRFGYLENATVDPTRQTVLGGAYAVQARAKILGKRTGDAYEAEETIWPNETSEKRELELVWAGMTSRYFGVAAHPLVDPDAPAPPKAFAEVERIDRIVPNPREADATDAFIAMRFDSGTRVLAPGAGVDLDMGVYAGPLSTKVIAAQPVASKIGMGQIVVYSFGGPCAFCTFSWLTDLLLGLLRFLHAYVVFDWALSIIMLVVIVRTCLHPVTKWSQIRMQRFGKQMQAMAPKQKKIQEKYKGDQKKIQEEMAKLWREEGINPAGMLGCLPMFLQTPIWIALYATLYFAVDLQHQGAFFGVFQRLFPLNWPVGGHFLGDLSEPDRFLYVGHTLFTIPFMGPISSLNILPIFLGIVFFLHQKYLTPPTSATMTPEQEQQQKIMKVMMVVMFPVIMYNAPSGLALYFIANSTLGIIESRHIRAHAEKHGLLEVDKTKRAGKPGFMGRMMQLAEQQRQLQSQKQAMSRSGQRDPGRNPKPKGPQPRRPKNR